jgi:hypothetical protein
MPWSLIRAPFMMSVSPSTMRATPDKVAAGDACCAPIVGAIRHNDRAKMKSQSGTPMAIGKRIVI